jgi:hypothetical protein
MGLFRQLVRIYKIRKERSKLIMNREIMIAYGFPLVIKGKDKNLDRIKAIDRLLK